MELRIFTEPQQGATYDDLLAVALRAEQLGFGAFFRSDHYLSMGGDGQPGPTDAWTTLAGLARDTTTIRLGTMMTSATFRYPGPLAIQVAKSSRSSGVGVPGACRMRGMLGATMSAGSFQAPRRRTCVLRCASTSSARMTGTETFCMRAVSSPLRCAW